MPKRSEETVLQSLEYYCGTQRAVVPDERKADARSQVASSLSEFSARWEPEGDPNQERRHYIEALTYELPTGSHPGFPWCAWGPTNADVLATNREAVVDAACDRIARWETLGDSEIAQIEADPTLIIKWGLRDPVRPFVKGEMHPSRKVNTPRLIMAISMVDQVVERYIFSDWVNEEKDNFPNMSNMVGIGRSPEHDRTITQRVKSITKLFGLGPTASDVSGWERSVSSDTMDEVALILSMKARGSKEAVQHWSHLCKVWAKVSARVTYIVNGKLYYSFNPGMMPSGTFLTSYGNGIMRQLFSYAAGSKYALTLGDDCLEWNNNPRSLIDCYTGWGLKTRDVQTFSSDGTEFRFCSKYYNSSESEMHPLVVPESWAKMVATYANLAHRSPAHYVALSMELQGLPGALMTEILSWAQAVRFVLPPGVEQK